MDEVVVSLGAAADLRRRLGDWPSAGRPLYAALVERLAALIERGELPGGVRLPAERRLATELNVSRGTVIAAYDELAPSRPCPNAPRQRHARGRGRDARHRPA